MVQEVPLGERPRGYVTYTAFAIKHCQGSDLLIPTYENTEFDYGSLAHGHITLVLKGCMMGVRFQVEGISVVTGENDGCVDFGALESEVP